MSDSPTPPFPPWMVRNGTTWTIVDFSDYVEGCPDVRHIEKMSPQFQRSKAPFRCHVAGSSGSELASVAM